MQRSIDTAHGTKLMGPQPVSTRALAMMVEAAAHSVRVVVLNACFTTVHADALRAKVDCIVGMGRAIGDRAARAFAIRFYGAPGNGRSIGNAVAQASRRSQRSSSSMRCCRAA